MSTLKECLNRLINWIGRGQDIEKRFNQLADALREETRYVSLIKHIKSNDNFREIVKMGWAVVPLILKRLQQKPSNLDLALCEITGITLQPDPEDFKDLDTVAATAKAWIKWGQENGYID